MFTYLMIGLILQIAIIITRIARKVTGEPVDWRNPREALAFSITIFIAGAINVVIWPITIVCEIINIKEGV